MTPQAWYDYAARTLAREREHPAREGKPELDPARDREETDEPLLPIREEGSSE